MSRHPTLGFVYGTGYNAYRRRMTAVAIMKRLKVERAMLLKFKTDKRYGPDRRKSAVASCQMRILELKIQMGVNYCGLLYLFPYETQKVNECQRILEQRHPRPDGKPWRIER